MLIRWVIRNVVDDSVVAAFEGAPNDNAAVELAVRSGTYENPVIDWEALGVSELDYRVSHTITDSCGNRAVITAGGFSIGLQTVLAEVTDISAPLMATDTIVPGCPIALVEWVIEDVSMADTAFPVEVARFSGPPNNAAGPLPEVLSGTYNSPIIDWVGLGFVGVFKITRIVTDSCGSSAVSASNEFTV